MSSDTKPKTPDVRIMDLGRRAGPEPAGKEKFEEFLRQFPIKHPATAEMDQKFAAKFIAEMPEEFEKWKSLIREEKDLISIILKFDQFLIANGFDQKYSSATVFFTLCEAARS